MVYNKCLVISQVPFSKIVYIEQTDFRPKVSKGYKRLVPGKTVLLRCIMLLYIMLMYFWQRLNANHVLADTHFLSSVVEVHADFVLAEDKKTIVEVHAEYHDRVKDTKPPKASHI